MTITLVDLPTLLTDEKGKEPSKEEIEEGLSKIIREASSLKEITSKLASRPICEQLKEWSGYGDFPEWWDLMVY